MSSDLFAAFGGEPAGNQADTARQNEGDFQSYEGQTRSLGSAVDEDDEFGDFEDASASNAVQETGQVATEPTNKSITAETPSGRSSNLPFSPKPIKTPESASQPAAATEDQSRVGQHPFAGNWDLLFGAGDDEYDAGADELGDLSNNPEAAMAYSKRIIAEQQAAQQKKPAQTSAQTPPVRTPNTTAPERQILEQTKSASEKLQKKSNYVPPRNTEVLFDAENVSEHEEEGDDFGDFETWEDSAPATKAVATTAGDKRSLPAVDLLGLDEPESNTSGNNGTLSVNSSAGRYKQRSDHDRITPSTARSHPAPTENMEDDAWDDFETNNSTPSTPVPPPASRPLAQPTSKPDQPKHELPPTNIPPPIILLSIFPSLLSSADDALFDTMAKLDLKQRQALLSHPASHQFLRGYLSHCTVLARVIAGRKLRWKRDQRLSQSMRIGPSAAGGKGGMKLAGLDKAELAKEEREVLDVLRSWRGQVGKLRTAVTAASMAPGLPKLPSVPDITEQMPVRVLKSIEGGMTAPHPCALCGLRRDERIAKVDVEVDDSFGEWWAQGANMHVGCKAFWEEFERKLKSR